MSAYKLPRRQQSVYELYPWFGHLDEMLGLYRPAVHHQLRQALGSVLCRTDQADTFEEHLWNEKD